jgi:hypothetical protein
MEYRPVEALSGRADSYSVRAAMITGHSFSKLRYFLVASALSVVMCSPLAATTFQLTPTFAGAYDPVTFEPLLSFDPNAAVEPAIIKFDLNLTVLELSSPAVAFLNVVYDFQLEDLFQSVSPEWQPNNPTYDIDGGFPGQEGHLFSDNRDIGAQGDLKNYIVNVNLIGSDFLNGLSPNDPRYLVGQNGPQLIGSAFFGYEGGNAELVVFPHQASYISESYNGAGGYFQYDPAIVLQGGAVNLSGGAFQIIAAIPEPASSCLFAISSLTLLTAGRCRRTV